MPLRELQVPNDGVSYSYRHENSVHSSNAIDLELQVGPKTVDQTARLILLEQLLNEKFFDNLRTKQQLGVIMNLQYGTMLL